MRLLLSTISLAFFILGMTPSLVKGAGVEEDVGEVRSCYTAPQMMSCNGFEEPYITQCEPDNLPNPMIVSSAIPGEGTVGYEVQVDGDFFADGGPPEMFLVDGDDRYSMTLLKFVNLHLTAQVPDVIPAGFYNLVATKCGNDSTSVPTSVQYRVRLPSNLVFDPNPVIEDAVITITGEFFGAAMGSITVQEQTDPPAVVREAEVLSWADDMITFRVPLHFSDNGPLNVTVTNATGSVQRVSALFLIGKENDQDLQVISAVAISNTEVLVQFSEPVMLSGAENPVNYQIFGPKISTAPPIDPDFPDSDEPRTKRPVVIPLEASSTEAEKTGISKPLRAVVGVLSAERLNTGFSTVLLTTIAQSDILYTVSASSIYDLTGNSFVPPTFQESNPSSAEFVGIGPEGGPPRDSDGDGLSDADEQLGWLVYTTSASGVITGRHVTSDPGNPLLPADDPENVAARDTDGDGVTDNEEKHGGLDPRTADTDGDTLTDNQEWNIVYSDPTNQDTDGDGTQDGFEFYGFRTSPILADTDGDQLTDTEEVLERNRDPRVSDLPLHGIDIGDIRLQIDERFTFEDAQGQTVTTDSNSSVTLTHGESQTRSFSASAVAEALLSFGGGVEFPSVPTGTPTVFSGKIVTFKGGREVQISQESSVESQQVREESFALARELSSSSTVTREIVGARIDVDVSIANRGDVAFTISNLEITMLERNRASTRRFVPVATLIANSTLITGEPAAFNLGPFTTDHGPILFTSSDVFPNLVDELMQSPSSLVFEIANFDITDEFGRLFTFSNQTARDRTAGIIVDSGDGQIERHLVATALQPDGGGPYDPAFPHVGGFNPDGSPVGIPIDFALQDIMELTKNAAIADGIVAGPDQIANSTAIGDDVQLIPPGTTGVSVGSIVISAGQDGILDTAPHPDDNVEVTTGYATSKTCSATSDNPRMICASNADCIDLSLFDPQGACTGPEVLKRFGSLSTGDFDRMWVVLTTGQVPAGAEFGQLVLKPGEDVYFAFVQDLDKDGLFAREEFLSGSTDSRADLFDNSTFGKIDLDGYFLLGDESFELIPPANDPDGIPDSKDTDRDGLGDFAENRLGWKVSADGGLLLQVMPSPRLADSDGDGLLDPQEQDLRKFCSPPFGGNPDGRIDALCSFESAPTVDQSDAIAIIAGPNGVADSLAVEDDEQVFPVGVGGLTYATAVIRPGANGIIDTTPGPDDQYESVESSQRIPPATDPTRSDTDLDGVKDLPELTGFVVGKSIRDGETVTPPYQAIAETLAIGDDVQQVFLGGPVFPGGIVVLPGPNGLIDSCGQPPPPLLDFQPCGDGDDVYHEGTEVKTDPLRRDTDADLVSDGRELAQGGNPRDPTDGDEFRDSDQDGLSDTEESILGWLVTANGEEPTLVLSNPSRPDSDFDGLPDFAERVLRTDPNRSDTDGDGLSDFDEVADFDQFFGLDVQFPGFSVDGASSQQYGTDPWLTDSDSDSLSDYFELLVGYRVLIGGEPSFRQVYTNPLVVDTDLDGVTDFNECTRGGTLGDHPDYCVLHATDATDPDTDDDGRSDGLEAQPLVNTDPLVPDVSVSVNADRIVLLDVTDPRGDKAEFMWFVTTQKNNDDIELLSSVNDLIGDRPWSPDSLYNINDSPLDINNPGPCNFVRLPSPRDSQPVISTIVLNKSGSERLEEGDSITVTGALWETEGSDFLSVDCGLPPAYIPSWIIGSCVTHFSSTFTFDDFADGGQATFPFPTGAGTPEGCEFELEIDVIGQ